MNDGVTQKADPILSDRLAQFVHSTHFEDLPDQIVRFSKQLMLDTLGVAWAGAGCGGCDVAHRTMQAQSGTPEGTIWAYGGKLPIASAAFVNSLFAAALDYDSFHQKGTLHSDIVVLPAALATAERERINGKDFIAAIAAANEIVCRLGLSTQQRTGWFYTSVHGVFGAAAATAKLLKGNAKAIQNALGLAFLNAAGTQQPAIERSMSKRLEGAFASRSGVQAGLLGAAGYEGPKQAFEGRFGLYSMYEQGNVALVTDELGQRFEMLETTIKRYPSCACAHAATDAALYVVGKNDLEPDMVADVEVVLSPYMARLVGAEFEPETHPEVSAQFSVQYAIAVAIKRRRFGLKDLEHEAIMDASIRELARRVQVKIDDKNDGVMSPVSVRIRTQDKGDLSHTVTAVPGTPELPLSNAEMLEKFRTCMNSGPRPLSSSEVDMLADRILNLERFDDMGRFFDGIAPHSAAQ